MICFIHLLYHAFFSLQYKFINKIINKFIYNVLLQIIFTMYVSGGFPIDEMNKLKRGEL